MLKDLGASNGKLAALTSFIALPWLFKPLWSPLVDTLKSKRWWIVATQLIITLSAAFIALTLSKSSLVITLSLFAIAALSSATHDISADGFYMIALDERRQPAFIGIRNTFYRVAMIFGQGVIIVFAGMIEKYAGNAVSAWRITFVFTALILALLTAYHSHILPKIGEKPDAEADKDVKLLRNFANSFASFFSKKGIFTAVLFMLFYRFPEALLLKMLYPFFSDPLSAGGLGLNKEAYGLICGSAGVAALLAGGISGGFYIAKHGLRKSLPLMALSLTLPCVVYPYLAFARPESLLTIGFCIAIDQFGYGFGFTAYIAYMMKFAAGPFRTSHYAICTGFMALSAILPGAISGYLQELCGYGGFFTVVVVSCTVTFAVTYLAAKNIES